MRARVRVVEGGEFLRISAEVICDVEPSGRRTESLGRASLHSSGHFSSSGSFLGVTPKTKCDKNLAVRCSTPPFPFPTRDYPRGGTGFLKKPREILG